MAFFRKNNEIEEEDVTEMSAGRISSKNRLQIDSVEELFDALKTEYSTNKYELLADAKYKKISEEDFMSQTRQFVYNFYNATEEEIEGALALFRDHIFGYSRITKLIEDPDITDIRCISYDNIRIKKFGKRQDAGIAFASADEYEKFINYVATRNQVNISNLNALQRFTDDTTSDEFVLRFTLSMPLINTYPTPILSIRKTKKDFYEMDDLVEMQMMSTEVKNYLISRFTDGSTIVCGGNSSGKTTILNALKETIPEDVSVLVAQQADELTTKNHPDMTFMHSLPGNGEGAANYDLEAISIAGLTMDIDFFIIGEVKGHEAMYLLNAAYTGQTCACTVHSSGADKAIDKIIDYALGAKGNQYTKNELLKMMDCFKTVIFMKDFKVKQVYEVAGYDEEKNRIVYKTVIENGSFIEQ